MKTKQMVFLFLVLSFSTTFAKEKVSPQLNFNQNQSVLYDMGNLGENGTMEKRPEMKGAENSLYGSYVSDDDDLVHIGIGSRIKILKDFTFRPGEQNVQAKNENYNGKISCHIKLRKPPTGAVILKKDVNLVVNSVERIDIPGKINNSISEDYLQWLNVMVHNNRTENRDLTPHVEPTATIYFSEPAVIITKLNFESSPSIEAIECRKVLPLMDKLHSPVDTDWIVLEERLFITQRDAASVTPFDKAMRDENNKQHIKYKNDLMEKYLKVFRPTTIGEFQRAVGKGVFELQIKDPEEIQ